jgi:DNA invertase Pin-like site-specific DNA recombinase
MGRHHNLAWPAHATVLGGLAEFERELIRVRTSEGRARAVKNGVRLGRKPKLTPHQIREVIRRRQVNGETLTDIAKTYNVNHTTIMRIVAAVDHSVRRRLP